MCLGINQGLWRSIKTMSVKRNDGSLHKIIKRHTPHTIVSWPNLNQWQMGHTSDFKIQDSRFKIALLLPIKHRIIYITVKSTWNVNTSTNTAMHYHGSKGSWKSCRIYGLLVCYTYSKYISTGVQRVQQKKKETQNDITSNYVSTTHAVHDFNTVQLK